MLDKYDSKLPSMTSTLVNERNPGTNKLSIIISLAIALGVLAVGLVLVSKFLTKELDPNLLGNTSGESETLRLIIDDFEIFDDGYRYEYPNPQDSDTMYFVDYDKGIHGQFHYSRALTKSEKSNWVHSGKLFDEDGNEIAGKGNCASFWAISDGYFVMRFPEDFPHGNYVYRMYQIIDRKNLTADIEFSI